MNRPIKFRVWDNKNKIWLDKTDFCIYNGDAQELEIGGTEYLSNGVSCNPLKFVGDDTGGLYYNSNLIIQQYTGLTDKNGKEIYEGDIIHLKFGELNANLVVKWDKYMGLQYHNGGWTSLVHVDTHGEVIGNIFEHSELLK
jgi:uncharacterized phage protein (TIGR01671 family)